LTSCKESDEGGDNAHLTDDEKMSLSDGNIDPQRQAADRLLLERIRLGLTAIIGAVISLRLNGSH
jgi:hypothetical protein